jgi:hypothetical protein
LNDDNPAYPLERVRPGILARLEREDWSAMTAAARASDNHPSSLARWERQAREADPSLSAEELQAAAEDLRRAFYRRAGAAGGRRAAQEARTAPALPPGHGRAGALARIERDGGPQVAAAMLASPNHPGRLDRWIRGAREQAPDADDGQAAELAAELRAGYFRRISAAGVAARQRAAADAAREVGAGPVILECPACGLHWTITARPDGSMQVNARCPARQGGCGKLRAVPRASTRRKMTRPDAS